MFLIMAKNYPIIFKNTLWFIFIPILVISIYLTINKKTILISWIIITSGTTQIQIPLILDPIGTIFSSSVLFISANIIQFTISYIKNDPFITRFSILVTLFISSINFLIFIPHMIVVLLGWDGLGITSFILVIYYQNPKSLAAGIITALTNRIGDATILLAIAWSLDQAQWSIIHIINTNISIFIIPIIILAAITKSAQIPFSSWLPAAIAAPTPVSALVHSSTLVTAGVFLLLRFYPSIQTIPYTKTILLIIATTTMFIAGTSAIYECDIKKIVALSTLSQLGVIIGAISFSLPSLGFFHLITHAIFKALLFMTAGYLITIFLHSQDLRSIGSLSNQLPFTTSMILLSSIALCGRPFLAGFYSKDIILEIILFNQVNFIILIIFITATLLTAAYSTRITLILIWTPSIFPPIISINEEDTNMTTPIFKITLIAISTGAIIRWIIFSPINEPIIPIYSKTLPIIITILGVYFITSFITTQRKQKISKYKLSNDFISYIWFISPLSTQNILKLPINISHYSLKILDHGWVESSSAQGLLILSSNVSKKIQLSNNNLITSFIIISISTIVLLYIIYICNLNKV